jgi:hypothetical protein
VQLYLHSPIRLHVAVLNYLSTGKILLVLKNSCEEDYEDFELLVLMMFVNILSIIFKELQFEFIIS